MTEQEKKIKRYVNAIERELRLPLKAKARINGDIGTDIHARLEKGQSIDCSHRCGSPFPSFWDAAPPACCCAGGKTGRVQSIRLL